MRAKNILLVGNYGAGNLGDDAIFAGIVKELKFINSRLNISFCSGQIKTSGNIYKNFKKIPFSPIKSLFSSQHKKAKEAFKKLDLIILGGGGLFIDSESIKAPIFWYKQARLAYKLNIPYVCYAQSVGPLKSFISRSLTRWVFSHAKYIHVRDEESVRLLKKLGIKSKVFVGTDPALSYFKTVKTKKTDLFLLSLRNWNKESKNAWQNLIESSREFASENNLKLALLAMDKNKKELRDLKKTGLKVFAPKSADEAFKLISSARVLLSMRLHAALMAYTAETPFLSYSYSQKVSSFFDTLEKNSLEKLKKNNLAFLSLVLSQNL